MNILTFDTEEWYIEKEYFGNRSEKYQVFDRYLKSILDILEEKDLKATFFCLGKLAVCFPEVVMSIAEKGHEIGCHSDGHFWLNTLSRKEVMRDTEIAIKSLEDLIGKKVLSYRAPAFSIGEKNKWALEVLAECGIERDASIYPALRDFGGFAGFPSNGPCIVETGGISLKEFPVSLVSIAGKQLAYSGGGYFRFFPLSFIKTMMHNSEYVMTYFHIGDLEATKMEMMPKEEYERYFKSKGTFKNRFIRMIKHSLGTQKAFDKMCTLVNGFDYLCVDEADKLLDWNKVEQVII